jgi:hypothetical protein
MLVVCSLIICEVTFFNAITILGGRENLRLKFSAELSLDYVPFTSTFLMLSTSIFILYVPLTFIMTQKEHS